MDRDARTGTGLRAGAVVALLSTLAACSATAEREAESAGGNAGTAGSAAASGGAGSAGTTPGSAGATPGSAGAGAGGVGMTAGSAGTPNQAGTAGTGGETGSTADACNASPAAWPSTALLHVPIEFVAGSSPFVPGEEFTTASGTAYRAGILAFFLSHAFLVTAAGERIPAQFADPNGSPRPYDLLLVNVEDLTAPALDLLAPAGTYGALELGIGVPTECNHIDPTRAVFPLNASSGLYWTWATGYMFIRVEGQVENADTWSNFFHHIGLDELYRTVTLAAELTVPTAAASPRLVVDVSRALDEMTLSGQNEHLLPEQAFADHFSTSGALTLRR